MALRSVFNITSNTTTIHFQTFIGSRFQTVEIRVKEQTFIPLYNDFHLNCFFFDLDLVGFL